MDEDKKKRKKWKKKKRVEADVGSDLRLHAAENAYALKKLLSKVEDHDAWDKNGDAPVHSYLRRRDKEKFNCLMTLLIHSHCDVNLANKDGQTALHLACEANDINFVKALIAFDAKVNYVNNSYFTPLDTVQANHRGSEVELLLVQLGGRTEIYDSDDDSDSGRASPYTEMDIEGQQVKESHIYRPRSIHHQPVANGYGVVDGDQEKSPSPFRQRQSVSPVRQLPSLPEEDKDSLVFKTAVEYQLLPHTGTASTTDRGSPDAVAQEETDSVENRRAPVKTQEESRQLTDSLKGSREGSYPIPPDESVEMGLTISMLSMIRQHQLNQIESTGPEDSVSSVSSACVLENTAFLQDSTPLLHTRGLSSLPSIKVSTADPASLRENLMAQAYGELLSMKDGPAGPEFTGAMLEEAEDTGFSGAVFEEADTGVTGAKLEEADVSEHSQRLATDLDSANAVAQSSPDELGQENLTHEQHVHFDNRVNEVDHAHKQHVHFDKQVKDVEKGSSKVLQLPLSYDEDGQKEKKKKKRFGLFRAPSSDGPMRSLSIYNPQMEVLTSIIGQGVIHRSPEKLGGQRVLCLDGGGVKGLIQIEMLKTIEEMAGKPIAELFDWVVGTSTGGILALGMIYGGLSLPHLRRMYFEMKDTVFKQKSKIISHTCDTDALEELLKRMLGTERRMDDVTKPNVLITAVDKRTTRLPLVFFTNCFDEIENKSVRNELVWKVARYTSAAPVFFAEFDNYVDGGVVANNPTAYALPEIQEFLTRKHGRGSAAAKISCVVSLGCGIYPPEPLGNTDIADALKITKLHRAPHRLGELLTLLTTALGGSEDISRLCRINCEQQGISYFRFSPEIGEDVGTTEKDNLKLCEIIIRAKVLFVENSEQVAEMIRLLGCSVQDDDFY